MCKWLVLGHGGLDFRPGATCFGPYWSGGGGGGGGGMHNTLVRCAAKRRARVMEDALVCTLHPYGAAACQDIVHLPAQQDPPLPLLQQEPHEEPHEVPELFRAAVDAAPTALALSP